MGKFDYLSLAVEQIWEVNRELIEQAPWHLSTAIHENDREAVGLRFKKVCQGIACQMEFSLQFPHNRQKQVKVDAHPIVNESGQVISIVGLVEDVTEQVQYREYLLEFTRKKEEIINKFKTKLGTSRNKAVLSLLGTANWIAVV